MTTRTIPLPMIKPAGELKQCTECGKCCTYVSVEINPPTSVRAASDILWYLYHEKVSIYRDGDGDWSVVFETRCRHLQQDLLCGIYAERPLVCRDFDNTTCDVNDPVGGLSFETAEEFLDFLKARRPALHRKVARAHAPRVSLPRPAAASVPRPAPSGDPHSSAGTPVAAPPGRSR